MANRGGLLLVLSLAAGAGGACYTGPDIGAATGGPSATEPTVDASAPPNGLPCEIAALIEKHCAACHASPPRTGAKTVLTSREALLASWEGRPLGVVSVERMRDVASPMPPEGLLSEADVAMFAKWVDDGMPEGTCGAVSNDVSHTPIETKCTSARFWTEGDDEGDEEMTPGQTCITCHTQENEEHARKHDEDEEDDELEAPAFTAAGTVYPTLHEPDDCFGLGTSGTQVVLTGADGRKLTLSVNRAGNFMTEAPLALPYTASVVRAGKTRTMKTPQTSGDCNGCHTAQGGDAPGRIVAP
ncbi:MAG TPA: hypothetical protein VM925_35070 [Labilithrix sp.]|nr:hypothetical protein [Labilithrix sp.]